MIKTTSTEFVIGYGLPGSGKTTLLKSLQKQAYDARFVDVDMATRWAQRNKKSVTDYLEDQLICYREKCITYVDGLFTTNEDLIDLLKIIKEVNKKYEKTLSITVHYWNEDRDSCIWNDEYRRDEKSIASIKSLPYETPDEKILSEKTGLEIKLIPQTVKRKEDYVHDINNLGFHLSGKYLLSESWCVGGTICDCWGGCHSAYVSDPVEFTQFDKFLEEKKPTITFLQYKKIWNECVSTDTYGEGDYYGGSVTYMYYMCDMEKLYKMLEEI